MSVDRWLHELQKAERSGDGEHPAVQLKRCFIAMGENDGNMVVNKSRVYLVYSWTSAYSLMISFMISNHLKYHPMVFESQESGFPKSILAMETTNACLVRV